MALKGCSSSLYSSIAPRRFSPCPPPARGSEADEPRHGRLMYKQEASQPPSPKPHSTRASCKTLRVSNRVEAVRLVQQTLWDA